MKHIPQDIIGDIAILKFPRRTFWLTKKIKAYLFLKQNQTIKTVLEKTEKISGELRIAKTKYLAGIKTKDATYKENECIFKFNVDETYFSPRLSNERKVIAEEVLKLTKKSGTKILVMFAGVGPYPITIARKLKRSGKMAIIISNELNAEANKYVRENIALNKLGDYVKVADGDARDLPKKLQSKFDIILMPRPQLDETFLKSALKLSKKGTVIFYHGFGTKEEVLEEIRNDADGKIGKIKIRKAGDIGPRRYRWQAEFRVK